MNNIIDNRHGSVGTAEERREPVSFREASLTICERIVDIIESETADIVSRVVAGAAAAVGGFAFAGAVLNGELGVIGTVLCGAAVAACGIFAFRTHKGF